MRVSNRSILIATAAVAVSLSFQAFSKNKNQNTAVYDTNAFDVAWTGEYYAEAATESTSAFDSFESKRNHFLVSPTIGVEEVELDDKGEPLKIRDAVPDEEPRAEASPIPVPSSSPKPFSVIPEWVPTDDPMTWKPRPLPRSYLVPNPEPTPTPIPSVIPAVKPQAFLYYDHGTLTNASLLDNDGRGYVKVFRERDEASGGRGWGTRAMIRLIQKVASEFTDQYPAHERLQVADIARKNGGKMSHGSHQNGLDADIVYLRKNRKEQPPVGAFGKNGFAEQFVIRGTSVRKMKDIHGKERAIRSYAVAPSANWDADANFHLLLMFHRAGNVKLYFMDKVLIREMFRYADEHNLTDDPEVRAMLMKLEHAHSHTDHFHVRLFCQETDSKCVSGNAPPRSRKHKSSAHRKVSK